MDAWLERAASFVADLDGAIVALEERLGFPFAWILFALAGLAMLSFVARIAAIGGARGPARPAASAEPRVRRGRAGETIRESADLARAAAPAAAPAVPSLGLVPVAIALVLIAGATVAVLRVRMHAPVDARPSAYLFGSLVVLVALALLRVGVGALLDRARTGASDWLADAHWTRDGTGPVAAERVGEGAVGIALFAAYLAPFHGVVAAPLTSVAFWVTIAILDLVFLLMLVFFARALWSRRLAGRARLAWTAAPFAPGETIRVRFATAKPLAEEATVVLRCLRASGSAMPLDHEPPPDAREVYSDTRAVRLGRDPAAGSTADLAIALPEHAPPSLRSADASVWWHLVVRARTAGPDFQVTFPIPVYRRSPSR